MYKRVSTLTGCSLKHKAVDLSRLLLGNLLHHTTTVQVTFPPPDIQAPSAKFHFVAFFFSLLLLPATKEISTISETTLQAGNPTHSPSCGLSPGQREVTSPRSSKSHDCCWPFSFSDRHNVCLLLSHHVLRCIALLCTPLRCSVVMRNGHRDLSSRKHMAPSAAFRQFPMGCYSQCEVTLRHCLCHKPSWNPQV